MTKNFRRKAILLVIALTLLLTGCGTESTIYNVSVHDVVIYEVKDEGGPHIDNYVLHGIIDGSDVQYKLSDVDLYRSIIKLQKFYAVSNPDELPAVDLIINTDIDRVIAVAVSPKE